MTLYNLKSSDGQWRITKFTNDLEVESSYITSLVECGCPAGSRSTCRHRQMLPKMLEVGAEDSGLFYDFESDRFFEPMSRELNEIESDLSRTQVEVADAVGSAELVTEPETESFEALAEQRGIGPEWREYARIANIETTDVSQPNIFEMLEKAAPHPSIGHIKRRI